MISLQSQIQIEESTFYECEQGVLIIDTQMEMNKCEVSEGKMDGVNVHSGHLVIQESKIQGNKNNGVSIKREQYQRD